MGGTFVRPRAENSIWSSAGRRCQPLIEAVPNSASSAEAAAARDLQSASRQALSTPPPQ
jgi:hypothetical protein